MNIIRQLSFSLLLLIMAACTSDSGVQPTNTPLQSVEFQKPIPSTTSLPTISPTRTMEPPPEGSQKETLPPRVITIVMDGNVIEIEEGSIEVAIDSGTGQILYEMIDGEWVEYRPRIFVIGEQPLEGYDGMTQISSSVIETAPELISAAEADPGFTRDGVPVELGLDPGREVEVWDDETQHVWWFGVNLGTGRYDHPENPFKMNGDTLYIGTSLPSGDFLISILPTASDNIGSMTEAALFTRLYRDGEVPATPSDSIRPSSFTENDFITIISHPKALGVTIHVRTQVFSKQYSESSQTFYSQRNLGWVDWHQVMLGYKFPDDSLITIVPIGSFAFTLDDWDRLTR